MRLKIESLLEIAESNLSTEDEMNDFRSIVVLLWKKKVHALGGQMADQFHPKFGTWVQQALDQVDPLKGEI